MIIDVAKALEKAEQFRNENQQRWSDCTQDKFNYSTRNEAEKVASIRRRHKGKSHDGTLRAYFCETCKAWHLTSKPKSAF
jgi:hypothetical protein